MNANEVKEALNENDIFALLEELGAEPKIKGKYIVCRTICHNPAHTGKHKLYYYLDSKMFHCYTECSTSMDIYGLVGKVLNLDFFDSFKYVCEKFGITYNSSEVHSDRVDMSFFEKFKIKDEKVELNVLDEKILNSYYDFYHYSWIEENISPKTMKKFNIKFSILNNQIIIPHYDLWGNLIGVRARNLDKNLVESGQKYMPVFYKGRFLRHPTGASLYGLNFNRKMIEKYKTIILVEAEKSVMQLDTMLPEKSIAVSISGSSLTNHQLKILNALDIEEVVIALDKEFVEVGSKEEKYYAQKITNVFIDKLSPRYRTSVIWDVNGLLNLKDSPTDKGLDVFLTLFENRIFV